MQIDDQGLVLNLKSHGENGLIATIFSKNHGLIKGYLKSSKKKNKLLLFDLILFSCRSRVESALGFISFERKNNLFFNKNNYIFSIIISSISELCLKLIPFNEKNLAIYNDVLNLLKLTNPQHSAKVYIKHYLLWEFYLLEHLGFGLDLSQCAVTGDKQNLRYVSPKTGRVVCEKIGRPWKEKILTLPNFFKNHDSPIEIQDLIDGFNLTNYFLNKIALNLFNDKAANLIFRKEIFSKLTTMKKF